MKPELVFHLAAQPLVIDSYTDPLYTFEVNTLGTANVLMSALEIDQVRGVVSIETDKVYQNLELDHPYSETDSLGGHDPYSASKAAQSILTLSIQKSFYNQQDKIISHSRSGNVFGGGDFAKNRLIPDIYRSFKAKTPLILRNPNSTRPWIFVMEPLMGYLLQGALILSGNKKAQGAWNFGPPINTGQSVQDIASYFKSQWDELEIQLGKEAPQFHEAKYLQLNSQKSQEVLGWKPLLSFEEAITLTTHWYQAYTQGEDLTQVQVQSYLERYFHE